MDEGDESTNPKIVKGMSQIEHKMAEVSDDTLKSVFDKIKKEDTFSQRIGVKLMELLPGFALATLLITEEAINIYQMAHGGAIFSVADHACEAAGNSYGEPAVALQQNIHFLSSAKSGDRLWATAKVTHRSTRIGLIEFEVMNQEGLSIAIGQQVIYFRKRRGDKG
jgi:acyl-CoA thioesterase